MFPSLQRPVWKPGGGFEMASGNCTAGEQMYSTRQYQEATQISVVNLSGLPNSVGNLPENSRSVGTRPACNSLLAGQPSPSSPIYAMQTLIPHSIPNHRLFPVTGHWRAYDLRVPARLPPGHQTSRRTLVVQVTGARSRAYGRVLQHSRQERL